MIMAHEQATHIDREQFKVLRDFVQQDCQRIGTVERELIEQVMVLCDQVQVKAAGILGINRNTLHKKVSEYERLYIVWSYYGRV